jgi:NarL family two-component system sensor histidine kinase LiaS
MAVPLFVNRENTTALGALVVTVTPPPPIILQLYLETWSRQSNIPAAFNASGDINLARPVEQSLYRVAQEALSNVARHSRATSVSVQLDSHAQTTTLTVRDNGVGMNENSTRGLGLSSMRERLNAVGGTLEIESAQGGGTTITARVPSGEHHE